MPFQWGQFLGGFSEGFQKSKDRQKADEELKLKKRIAADQAELQHNQAEYIKAHKDELIQKVETQRGQESQRSKLREVVGGIADDSRFTEAGVEPPTPEGAAAAAAAAPTNPAYQQSIKRHLIGLPATEVKDLAPVLGLPGTGSSSEPKTFQQMLVEAARNNPEIRGNTEAILGQVRNLGSAQNAGMNTRIATLIAKPNKTAQDYIELGQLYDASAKLSAQNAYAKEQGQLTARQGDEVPAQNITLPQLRQGQPQAAPAPAPVAAPPAAPAPQAAPGARVVPLGPTPPAAVQNVQPSPLVAPRPGMSPYNRQLQNAEEAKQAGKPLEAGDRAVVTGLEKNLEIAKQLKTEFTNDELQQYIGIINSPVQRFTQIFRDPKSPEAIKFARFQTLTAFAKAFAFSEAGQQLTNSEKAITFGHIPTGGEFNLANYIANLDGTIQTTQGTIDKRIKYATTPRGQLGNGQQMSPPSGAQSSPRVLSIEPMR